MLPATNVSVVPLDAKHDYDRRLPKTWQLSQQEPRLSFAVFR